MFAVGVGMSDRWHAQAVTASCGQIETSVAFVSSMVQTHVGLLADSSGDSLTAQDSL